MEILFAAEKFKLYFQAVKQVKSFFLHLPFLCCLQPKIIAITERPTLGGC